MNLEFERKPFLSTLTAMQQIISVRTDLAITASVLFDNHDGKLRLSCTNLQTSYQATPPWATGEVDKPFAIRCKMLMDIAKQVDEETVSIVPADEGFVRIAGKFTVMTVDGDDYPDIDAHVGDDVDSCVLPAETLIDVIERTGYIDAPSDEKRVHVVGARLSIDKGRLQILSTDSRRLVSYSASVKDDASLPGILLPKKALISVAKMLHGAESVTLERRSRMVAFAGKHERLLILPLEGDFPDLSRLTSSAKNPQGEFVVRKSTLAGIASRAELMDIAGDMSVGMVMKLGEDELVVDVANPMTGEYREAVEIKYDGPETAIILSTRYLKQAVNAIQADDVVVKHCGPDGPFFVMDAEGVHLNVIMPRKSN